MRTNQKTICFVITIFLFSCNTQFSRNLGLALQGIGNAGTTASGYSQQTEKLLIFGGSDHKTYLGCLNCSEYDKDSVFNTYGSHGSEYSSVSIMNSYSEFGSHYSSYSACNEYASDPPVVVDLNGKYYGRLTINNYKEQINNQNIVQWLISSVCKN